jgi:D-lactate dehydrogenase (cytochrome)
MSTVAPTDIAASLIELLGSESKVSVGSSILAHHARDGGLVAARTPDVVVFPESTGDVATVLRFANEYGIPVTPYGAGTSQGGKTVPLFGGISLDLLRMDNIVAVHGDDFDAVVQAGVLRKALNTRVAEHGLFFPVDPGADASLGGMASMNASGTTTVRYGGMRANILALEVVLADGSVVRTGARARKSSAGYDMTSLLIGSEGTLGVITELTLRLHPIPEKTVVARVSFADLTNASKAVVALTATSSSISRIELLDAHTLSIVNAHFGTELAEAPTLWIEYGGTAKAIEEDIEFGRELWEELGSIDSVVESDPTAQHRIWEARHDFGYALFARHPGKIPLGTDICVPISELPSAIAHARELIDETGLEASLVAHAGDGNFHFAFMVDPDSDEPELVKQIHASMVEHALACGGTSSAEKGIGVDRQDFLLREHGDLVPAMRAVKAALDPSGILNPGKIFSDAAPS